MVAVGIEVRTIDQDIVEVNYNAVVEERTEDVVDKTLEGGRGIGETERHYCELIMTVARAKGHLWYILILDADLVVARAKVEFGKYFGALDSIKDLIYARERVPILDGQFIQGSIVDTHPQASVFLFNKQDRGTIR